VRDEAEIMAERMLDAINGDVGEAITTLEFRLQTSKDGVVAGGLMFDKRTARLALVKLRAMQPTVEAGTDGKPQTVPPGAERASDKDMARRKADAPLKAKAAQQDVGVLFGDDAKQTDLLDLPGAKSTNKGFDARLFANNKIFTLDKVEAARARLHSKFVVVHPVKQAEESLFMSKVEAKFRALVEESPDPQCEIQDAAQRMEAEDMLWQRPWPNSNPRQAAFQMFGDNEALTEWWMDIRDRGWWASALTPEELITAILPKYDTLD
jgi:hypothetical protein